MNMIPRLLAGMLVILGLSGGVSIAAGPDDLALAAQTLSDAVDRLARALEKEALQRTEDHESRRVTLAVGILGLRYRKIERLEGELRDLEREEDGVKEGVTMIKAEIESLEEKSQADMTQAGAEERQQAAQYQKQIKFFEERQERLREQIAAVQVQIATERRRLGDLEAVVDAWLDKLR